MKYLGIDYGTKRIGIAISDDEGTFAFPYSIIPADTTLFESIKIIVEKEKVESIVIGESVASNGAPNELVEQSLRFKKKLETFFSVPVYFEREGYSTVEAHRYQVKAGNRDDSAAAIILQRYLDKGIRNTSLDK